jgi:hypothetical protein
MSLSRSEISQAVSAPKQLIDVSDLSAKLGYSNTNLVETFNTPAAIVQLPYGGIQSRKEMLGGLQSQNLIPLKTAPPEPGGGIFDIPVLGPALDLLDAPRAYLMSTIKEVGDIFGNGDASLSEWYKQAQDNIMASEVLRDWGVDLPGPLDFVVGLGLDIALDPLTYAFGAGVVLRAARVADVAVTLSNAARTAEIAAETARKAGNVAEAATQSRRAQDLLETFDIVRREGTLSAVAKKPLVMEELGVNRGIHFSLPGTGRIGRRIVERPLTSIVPKLGERAARNRVATLARSPWLLSDDGFDVAKNADAIVARMTGGEAPQGVLKDAIEEAARKASRLPIAKPFGNAAVQNATSKIVGSLGGGVGRSVTAVALAPKMDSLLRKFNSKGSIINAKRGVETETARVVFDVERSGNQAAIAALRWNKQTTDELDRLVRDLRTAGIQGEDLDSLMFYAATSTDEEILANPALARWINVGADGSAEVSPFVAQAKEWWKSAGRRAGIPEDELNDFFYASRMRDDIEFKRGNASRVDPEMDGIPLDNKTLSGTPTHSRRLLTPKQIKQRINDARTNKVSEAEVRAYADDIDRIEAKVLASQDAGKPKTFEQVLDEEIANGVRYGKDKFISTNVYAGVPLDDSNILNQMAKIAREATDIDPKRLFKFSDDASVVLPRYISLMTKNIRSQTLLKLVKNKGYMIGGNKLKQGDLASRIETFNKRLQATELELTNLRKALVDAEMDEDEVANILAEIAKKDGIFSEADVRAWLASTDGQLAAQVADMEVQINTLFEVLNAAANGKFYTGLSAGARDLLDAEGWRDAVTGPFTKAQRAKIQRLVADNDARLEALAEATEFLHELQLIAGRLQTQRNQIGAALAQLETGRNVKTGGRMRPATIRKMLEDQAAELDEVFEQLRFISDNIKGNLEAFDPTLIAGRGLAALGDPELMAQAQRQLFEDMIGVWGLSDDLRRVAGSITDLPADGRLVSIDWKGGSIGWDIRWKSQPLAGQGDRTTLRTLMGEERADYMGRILATLDDSPAGRAQAAVLETIENLRLMQNRLGNIVPNQQLVDAVEQSIGDADALVGLLRREYQTDLDLMIDSMLDQRLKLTRKSPAVRETMEQLEAETVRIQSEIDAKVEELQEIARNVKNEGNRRVLIRAALFDGPDSLTQRRNAARKAASRGDTTAALDIAENPVEALRAVAKGQGNQAFVDLYMEGAESVIADMLLHTFKVGADDTFSPRVGNITKSKLTGQSFVAPLSANLTAEQTREMALVFSEVFEAMARTADPAQLNGFLRGASRLANWWKAQAVGTPGFVMRNMLGAMWMNNQLAGVPLSQFRRVHNIRDAAMKAGDGNVSAGLGILIEQSANPKNRLKMSAMAGGGTVDVAELRTFKEWYDSGIAAGTGGRGIDIRSAVNEGQVIEGRGFKTGFEAGTLKPTADFKPFTAIRGWNADVEFMARGSLAHHTMMGGGSVNEALEKVYKYHFDYTDLTAFEVGAKTFIPFWTWQRRAMPMLLESVARNPTAWNRVGRLKANLELHSPEEGVVPSYFGENMGIRLPFKVGGHRTYMLPSLPFADLANWSKGLDEETLSDPLEFATSIGRVPMESAIPHFRFPIEAMLGVRTFNQVPFRDELKPAPKWANVPVMAQALQVAGLAERSNKGTLLMTDKQAYGVEQFIPVLANWSRLDPISEPKWERSDAAKQIATFLNFTLGVGLRVNTPKEKRNEMFRQMYTKAADDRRREALRKY